MTQFNAHAFGVLISWLSFRSGTTFDKYEIETLQERVTDCITVTGTSPLPAPSPEDVRQLLHYMATPGMMVDAIKAYRMITGDGLVESKKAIEAVYAKPAPSAELEEKWPPISP